MSPARPAPDHRFASHRVALLEALIGVLHRQRHLAAAHRTAAAGMADPLAIDPRPAHGVAAWTEQLLAEGLVSPGELGVMHQRAQAVAEATRTPATAAMAA